MNKKLEILTKGLTESEILKNTNWKPSTLKEYLYKYRNMPNFNVVIKERQRKARESKIWSPEKLEFFTQGKTYKEIVKLTGSTIYSVRKMKERIQNNPEYKGKINIKLYSKTTNMTTKALTAGQKAAATRKANKLARENADTIFVRPKSTMNPLPIEDTEKLPQETTTGKKPLKFIIDGINVEISQGCKHVMVSNKGIKIDF